MRLAEGDVRTRRRSRNTMPNAVAANNTPAIQTPLRERNVSEAMAKALWADGVRVEAGEGRDGSVVVASAVASRAGGRSAVGAGVGSGFEAGGEVEARAVSGPRVGAGWRPLVTMGCVACDVASWGAMGVGA